MLSEEIDFNPCGFTRYPRISSVTLAAGIKYDPLWHFRRYAAQSCPWDPWNRRGNGVKIRLYLQNMEYDYMEIPLSTSI